MEPRVIESSRMVQVSTKNGSRPSVRGKFLFVGEEKFLVKGVSYGAFRPDGQKREYQDHDLIERDFALMAAGGVNTVRIPHTMPPRSLLDAAQRHGLYVMVGLSAEQYVGFLIDRKKKGPDVVALVREKVRAVAGHPALLCYSIGNEIPTPMARWLGRRRVERYLHQLYAAIKSEDPEGIVTYVNYPSTEYLQLPFLDLVSFNVYLESEERLRSYLARLQNIAGDRPLLMSEVGLDAIRNGEQNKPKCSTGKSEQVSLPVVRESSFFPGRTSGIAREPKWTIGLSGSRIESGSRSRLSPRCKTRSGRFRFHRAFPGRPFPW